MQDDNFYIEQILKGNVNAFTELVNRHKRMVYTFALRMVKNPQDAEEIAHDVFVKAYQGLAGFKKESKFATWLYRISYNESISWLRKKKLQMLSVDDPGFNYQDIGKTESFIKELNDREQKAILLKALDKLPDDERSVITLFYLQECSIKEIIEITGFSESNVKIKLFRARKRLWEKLKYTFKEKITGNYASTR